MNDIELKNGMSFVTRGGDKPSKYRLEWTHRENNILYYWDFDNLEQALDYKQLKENVETIEEIKLYKVVYIEIK